MAVENEEISLAVCNLLQAIIDSLSGEDKREHRGKEEALVLGRSHVSVWVLDSLLRSLLVMGVSFFPIPHLNSSLIRLKFGHA